MKLKKKLKLEISQKLAFKPNLSFGAFSLLSKRNTQQRLSQIYYTQLCFNKSSTQVKKCSKMRLPFSNFPSHRKNNISKLVSSRFHFLYCCNKLQKCRSKTWQFRNWTLSYLRYASNCKHWQAMISSYGTWCRQSWWLHSWRNRFQVQTLMEFAWWP